jgi:hypothetical protein
MRGTLMQARQEDFLKNISAIAQTQGILAVQKSFRDLIRMLAVEHQKTRQVLQPSFINNYSTDNSKINLHLSVITELSKHIDSASLQAYAASAGYKELQTLLRKIARAQRECVSLPKHFKQTSEISNFYFSAAIFQKKLDQIYIASNYTIPFIENALFTLRLIPKDKWNNEDFNLEDDLQKDIANAYNGLHVVYYLFAKNLQLNFGVSQEKIASAYYEANTFLQAALKAYSKISKKTTADEDILKILNLNSAALSFEFGKIYEALAIHSDEKTFIHFSNAVRHFSKGISSLKYFHKKDPQSVLTQLNALHIALANTYKHFADAREKRGDNIQNRRIIHFEFKRAADLFYMGLSVLTNNPAPPSEESTLLTQLITQKRAFVSEKYKSFLAAKSKKEMYVLKRQWLLSFNFFNNTPTPDVGSREEFRHQFRPMQAMSPSS